jgi:glutaredoxin 3
VPADGAHRPPESGAGRLFDAIRIANEPTRRITGGWAAFRTPTPSLLQLKRTATTYTLAGMADEKGVVVYTTEPCGFCRQAKALLAARGFNYAEINLAKDPVGRADLVALTGQMTFPQIVVGQRAIGGFRELLEADRAGGLEELLAA